jgi:hypothetical protein
MGTAAILITAAILTPTGTGLTHTDILMATDIAALTTATDITRAIDMRVTILTVEPIIDPRATILIAGRKRLPRVTPAQ